MERANPVVDGDSAIRDPPERLPGDVWEVDGARFKLSRWSDGYDGPQGWLCDPGGWVGEACFVADRATLISRTPALSHTLNGDVEVGWRASARGTWQAFRRVGAIEKSDDTGIVIVPGVGPPVMYPWRQDDDVGTEKRPCP